MIKKSISSLTNESIRICLNMKVKSSAKTYVPVSNTLETTRIRDEMSLTYMRYLHGLSFP